VHLTIHNISLTSTAFPYTFPQNNLNYYCTTIVHHFYVNCTIHILWKVLKNKITSTKCVYKMDGMLKYLFNARYILYWLKKRVFSLSINMLPPSPLSKWEEWGERVLLPMFHWDTYLQVWPSSMECDLWKNYSGSLRNYETVSYEWLLKGPFNGPKSLFHHKTDSRSPGKATILTHFF
jgi:hypothetical protein